MTDLVEAALEYKRRGYFPIPVRITLNNGKKDIDWFGRSWSEYVMPDSRSEAEPDFVYATGFAFDCGRSGIAVVETDVKNGVDGADILGAAGIVLDTHAMVISQSGGVHHYFANSQGDPVSNSAGVIAENVDVRGVGGVIVAPGSWVEGGGSYDLVGDGGYLPDLAGLPPVPAVARSRRTRNHAAAAAWEGYTPPVLTTAQRAVGARIAKAKLAQIRVAPPGQRNDVLKVTVPRIIGIGKAMGVDLEKVGNAIRDAYPGDDAQQIEDWIRNATAKAVPDDHTLWESDPAGVLSEDDFWSARPELEYIRVAALEATASPWAVLGALIPRVLSGVPPTWTLDTKVGTSRGNLNAFSVLAADSGGGKGIATETAEYLWPVSNDVMVTDTASGEALPRLFSNREQILRSSVIIDIDEYAALAASKQRAGSTLAFKLSSAWSGKALSLSYADESKSVQVPAGSYRLGMVAGVQYGNAQLLLSADDEVQGYTKRFLWFPAEIDYEPDFEADTKFPAPMKVTRFHNTGPVSIQIPAEVVSMLRRARSAKSGLDGHSLYVRVKAAYALAVLGGRTDHLTVEDWELAGVVSDVSDRTREKARAAMKKRSVNESRSRGEMDGIRQDAALESRVHNLVKKYRAANPAISNGEIRRALKSDLRDTFDVLYPKPS